MKLVPKRRFKGFSGEWEERRLGHITESFSGGTPSVGNSEYYGGDIPFIRSGEIDAKRTKLHISKEGLNNSAAKTVLVGDILYALYGATSGEVSISKINGAINQAILAIRAIDNDDHYLIAELLKAQKDKIINTYLQGGQGNLSGTIVKQLLIRLPIDKTEQGRISSFLQKYDAIVNLQLGKLEKLQAMKQAYLHEMFPAEGKNVPKRRFKGFAKDWRKRRVKDIFTITRGNVLAVTKTVSKKTNTMPYPVYSSQTKDKGLMGYYNEFLYQNAITWTTDGANAGTVNYRKGKFYCTNVCGVLISNEGFANEMVSEALNRVTWKHVSKVGNPKLMNNVMGEIIILLPEEIEEQKVISEFIRNVDQTIAFQQQKLKKLKAMKQAYLHEMFV